MLHGLLPTFHNDLSRTCRYAAAHQFFILISGAIYARTSNSVANNPLRKQTPFLCPPPYHTCCVTLARASNSVTNNSLGTKTPVLCPPPYRTCCVTLDCSYAAAHQPFILIPGANHAQTSNGVANYARGDIPATTEYASTTEQLGKAVGAFMSSHQAARKSEREAAADELLVMVRRTAEMLGPYFMASGGRLGCPGEGGHLCLKGADVVCSCQALLHGFRCVSCTRGGGVKLGPSWGWPVWHLLYPLPLQHVCHFCSLCRFLSVGWLFCAVLSSCC